MSPTYRLTNPALQQANNTSLQPQSTVHDVVSMIRYDLEVSGFSSSHSGHLLLLRLQDQDYPGASRIEDWPSWNLPNYQLPAFDSIGANGYLVDVTHGAVDFVSGAQFHPAAELNYWYHTLNCGFPIPMLGETDFPCLSDERPGTGRTYVGLAKLGRVSITAKIAARLDETTASSEREFSMATYWHLERARIADTRTVLLEIIVNDRPIASQNILADGVLRELRPDLQAVTWVTGPNCRCF